MRTYLYFLLPALAIVIAGFVASRGASAAKVDDAAVLAALDTDYQRAVESNDWRSMDRILHADFVLVLGDGRSFNRAQLIESAREKHIIYQRQVEIEGTQTVRLFGKDTATITALLDNVGEYAADKKQFDRRLWFTDTYVRTPQGWRYAFGQASLPLPEPVLGSH